MHGRGFADRLLSGYQNGHSATRVASFHRGNLRQSVEPRQPTLFRQRPRLSVLAAGFLYAIGRMGLSPSNSSCKARGIARPTTTLFVGVVHFRDRRFRGAGFFATSFCLRTLRPLPASRTCSSTSTSPGRSARPASHRQRRLIEMPRGRPSSPAGAPWRNCNPNARRPGRGSSPATRVRQAGQPERVWPWAGQLPSRARRASAQSSFSARVNSQANSSLGGKDGKTSTITSTVQWLTPLLIPLG